MNEPKPLQVSPAPGHSTGEEEQPALQQPELQAKDLGSEIAYAMGRGADDNSGPAVNQVGESLSNFRPSLTRAVPRSSQPNIAGLFNPQAESDEDPEPADPVSF